LSLRISFTVSTAAILPVTPTITVLPSKLLIFDQVVYVLSQSLFGSKINFCIELEECVADVTLEEYC
jgi:hypothetical protein